MNVLFIGIVIFLVAVFLIETLLYAHRSISNPERRELKKRLRASISVEYDMAPIDILKRRVLSDVPFLNKILLHIPGIPFLSRLLHQANVRSTVGVIILLSIILALAGYLGCSLITLNSAIALMTAAAFGTIPFFYLRRKKKKRMEKFLRQLPDGLELIGRALRAGHAFTSGMKLAADEFDDPLGPEFGLTLDEINFGVSVPDALKNLANRIDCPDLRYFVISVILQRETGGNLAEIIDAIAHLIRERFKLKGKIRVLSAEGKLTATILFILPFVVLIAVRFTSPDYLETLITEPAGRIMAGIAFFMMLMGALVMKKLINIKV